MFLVITTLSLREGAADDCLALFQQRNPALVADQSDWTGAEFTLDRAANSLTVIARWRNADSYRGFSESERFRTAMAEFAPFFAGPPSVQIVERLWRMGRLD